MLNRKVELLSYLSSLQCELKKINLETEMICQLEDSIKNAELLIPVVGAFSSGKSSLINSLIGNSILPVGLTPETSLATEIRFSEKEFVEAVKNDSESDNYSIEELNIISEKAHLYKHLKVFINNEIIKKIEPLILVDMPGFNSPLDLHNQAIMQYINKGSHYIFITSVEDGTLTRSMIRQLSDILEFDRDFTSFLSKTNLKSAEDTAKIQNLIDTQIKNNFDLSKNTISIDNNGGESLDKVLMEIDSENLFEKICEKDMENLYFSISDTINTKIFALKKDKRTNEEAIKEITKGLSGIIETRDKLIIEAKEKHSDVKIERIIEHIGKDLTSSINELITTAKNGGQEELSKLISEIVRHSLIEKIKLNIKEIGNDIINNMNISLAKTSTSSFSVDENWLQKVSENIRTNIIRGQSLLENTVEQRKLKENAGKLYKTATSILAITTSVINPFLELLIVFLPDIISFISSISEKKRQEEELRRNILSKVIPSVKRKLGESLPSLFNEQVMELINSISSEFETKLEEKKKAITEAEEERREMSENISIEIEKYEKASEKIRNLSSSVIFNR